MQEGGDAAFVEDGEAGALEGLQPGPPRQEVQHAHMKCQGVVEVTKVLDKNHLTALSQRP